MHHQQTLPLQGRATTLPIRSLQVSVVSGEQAGELVVADEDTLSIGSAAGNDLVLRDDTVSRYHLELLRREDGVQVRDTGSTNGTFVGAIRVREATVPLGTELRLGRCVVSVLDGDSVAVDLVPGDVHGDLVGSTAEMRRLFARTQKVALTNAAVLIGGESGTGKELIARALHDQSERADHPFVTVDCASLLPTLMASELFGHERGAFTGANQRHIGAFERAHRGTIFLDEIGELPADLQPNLLGALERRRFRRLGGREEVQVDVRVICATNRDLRAQVNTDAFRLDLYFRIAVVRLEVPALRDRLADIPLLVERFLSELGDSRTAEQFMAEIDTDLLRHPWPGNVRELRNFVEAAVAMGETPELDGVIAVDEGEGFGLGREAFLGLPYKQARALILKQFESHYLPHILAEAGGNVSKAARESGMDRSHLSDLLHRHGLR